MSKKTVTEYRAKIKEYLEHITNEKDLAFFVGDRFGHLPNGEFVKICITLLRAGSCKTRRCCV